MRFLSRFQKYRIEAIGQKWDMLANGQIRELKAPVFAEFAQEALHPWEEKAAREHFHFTGTVEEDELSGIPVDPITRVSVFDSVEAQNRHGWTDDTREQVEQNLLKARGFGQNSMDYIQVVKPTAPKPWPTYDDFTDPQKIVAFVETSGITRSDVVAYEQDNLNRPEVLNALRGLEEPTVVKA